MGLFSRSDSMGSKAKIEELKRKIAQDGVVEPVRPAQEPAPAPVRASVATQAPVSSIQEEIAVEPPEQMERFAQEQMQHEQQIVEEPVHQNMDFDHSYQEKEVEHMDGVILDIGNGMSLNLPIRSRMKLEEFLEIADKVKELKRINFG